jgi:hypothetical protein
MLIPSQINLLQSEASLSCCRKRFIPSATNDAPSHKYFSNILSNAENVTSQRSLLNAKVEKTIEHSNAKVLALYYSYVLHPLMAFEVERGYILDNKLKAECLVGHH